MANIIKLMDLLSDEEIRMQIALFESVNMGNVAREAGNRLLLGLADVANAFSETFTNKSVVNFEFTTTADAVMDRYIELQKTDRDELNDLCIKKTLDIYKEINGKEYTGDVKSPIYTKEIVNIAAYNFNINKYKPLGSKLDEIEKNYEKMMLNAIYTKMSNLSNKDYLETVKLMDMSLIHLSLENRQKLQRVLTPVSFNGKGVISALRKRKDLDKIKTVYEILEDNAFKMVDIDLSIIYATLRGLGRVSRCLIARFIYMLVKKSDTIFSIANEKLPSGNLDTVLDNYRHEDGIFREKLANQIAIQKKIDEKKKNEIQIQNQAAKLEEEIDSTLKDFYEAKNDFSKLDAIKSDYLKGKRSSADSKVYYGKVNESKRKMDRFSDLAERKSNRLTELKTKLDEIKEDIRLEELNLDKAKAENKTEVDKKADELMKTYLKRFNRVKFEPGVFYDIVVRFSLDERLEIERFLLEIEEEDDYYSFDKSYVEIPIFIGGRKTALLKMDDYLCKDII